jgi:hypothetical protein
MSVKYGAGKWHELARLQPGMTIKTNGGEFRFKSATAAGNQVTADCEYDYDENYEVTIVGVDHNGAWSPLEQVSGLSQFSEKNRHFYGTIRMPLENIAYYLAVKRLFQEELFSKVATRPRGSVPETKSASITKEPRESLRDKFKLASSMTLLSEHDEAIAAIAKRAAQARDVALTREAIHEIKGVTISDAAAVDCARIYLKNGMRKDAVDLIEMISVASTHDDALKELMQ